MFAKLRNATLSFVSVSPPVRMKQLGSRWTDFNEIWHLSNFRKTIEKIQILLMSEKNDEYFV